MVSSAKGKFLEGTLSILGVNRVLFALSAEYSGSSDNNLVSGEKLAFVVEGWLMHRGGVAGGGSGGGGEHPPTMPGAPGFSWGAMLAGHHAAAAAGTFAGGEAHHVATHPPMPMDLHVSQAFPYYRFVFLFFRPKLFSTTGSNFCFSRLKLFLTTAVLFKKALNPYIR